MGSGGDWMLFSASTGEPMSLFYGANKKMKEIEAPKIPDLPAPVEEIDLAAQQDYSRKRLKGRKGRSSTILGSNNKGKTVLG